MHTTRWFRAADAIPMIVCVAAAVALLIAQVSAKTGAQAVVKTPTGETYLSLSEDGEWEFVGKDGLTDEERARKQWERRQAERARSKPKKKKKKKK